MYKYLSLFSFLTSSFLGGNDWSYMNYDLAWFDWRKKVFKKNIYHVNAKQNDVLPFF